MQTQTQIKMSIPYFDRWETFSLEQLLQQARNRRNMNTDHLTSLLYQSRLNDDFAELSVSPFTGKCSQGWIDFESQVCPKFQEAYSWVSKLYRDPFDPPTPLEYLIHFYREGVKLGLKTANEFDLGRALRNWVSLKREEILIDLMRVNNLQVETPSVGNNVSKHADIYFHHPRGKIIIWSYLSTHKGIENLVKKLLKRGFLERGLNLLSPIDEHTDTESYKDWWIPTSDYLDRMLQACETEPIPFLELKDKIERDTEVLKGFILFN